jgi:hypothetical protein
MLYGLLTLSTLTLKQGLIWRDYQLKHILDYSAEILYPNLSPYYSQAFTTSFNGRRQCFVL